MCKPNVVDFGPLNALTGVWTGDDGVDVAPEPDGAETNPYFETITYSAVGRTIIEVAAKVDDDRWQIVQSPFMQGTASTTEFRQKVVVGDGRLSYSETTMLEIYGKEFEHTDQNELIRQRPLTP